MAEFTKTTMYLALLICLALIFHDEKTMKGVEGCHKPAHVSSGNNYYLGYTDLDCLSEGKRKKRGTGCDKKRRKRGAYKKSNTWELTHSYIKYVVNGRSYYYELLGRGNVRYMTRSPAASDRCTSRYYTTPKGSSRVTKECLAGCARWYEWKEGQYNLVLKNCHNFVNTLFKILYDYRYGGCPSWCKPLPSGSSG